MSSNLAFISALTYWLGVLRDRSNIDRAFGNGGFGGGTIDSMIAMMEREEDKTIFKHSPIPMCSTILNAASTTYDRMSAYYDKDFDSWVGRFVVSWSEHARGATRCELLSGLYGNDFRYNEGIVGQGCRRLTWGYRWCWRVGGVFVGAASMSFTRPDAEISAQAW